MPGSTRSNSVMEISCCFKKSATVVEVDHTYLFSPPSNNVSGKARFTLIFIPFLQDGIWCLVLLRHVRLKICFVLSKIPPLFVQWSKRFPSEFFCVICTCFAGLQTMFMSLEIVVSFFGATWSSALM